MKEKIFIKRAKELVNLEEFIRKDFEGAKIGSIEIQHTPIVTRIVINTITPGLVIGSGGERIREAMQSIRKKFSIENPQIDVQRIDIPDLEPFVVAQTIQMELESGQNVKRVGNFALRRIMNSGAVGCEIVMSGKVSGARSRVVRFNAGYIKKCGNTSIVNVRKGYAVANLKMGTVGITVKIMIRMNITYHPEKIIRAKQDVVKENVASETSEQKVAESDSPVGDSQLGDSQSTVASETSEQNVTKENVAEGDTLVDDIPVGDNHEKSSREISPKATIRDEESE